MDLQRHLLDFLPIWALFLLTIGVCLLAVEGGFRFGTFWKRTHPEYENTDIGAMLGATLGLWAFLLTFLVGMATTRYEERRALVVRDANAIGTAFLRAGYLPAPYAAESRALLLEYARSRTYSSALEGFKTALAAADTGHVKLWKLAESMAETTPANPANSLYIAAINEVIDVHGMRVASLTSYRVPYTIYLAMYIVGVLALFMLGFNSSTSGRRNWIVSFALILVFSTIMMLFIDLDRPWGGLIQVSQQPMIDVVNTMAAWK